METDVYWSDRVRKALRCPTSVGPRIVNVNLPRELAVSNRCLAQGPDSGSVQYVTITDACFHVRQTLRVHSRRAEYK